MQIGISISDQIARGRIFSPTLVAFFERLVKEAPACIVILPDFAEISSRSPEWQDHVQPQLRNLCRTMSAVGSRHPRAHILESSCERLAIEDRMAPDRLTSSWLAPLLNEQPLTLVGLESDRGLAQELSEAQGQNRVTAFYCARLALPCLCHEMLQLDPTPYLFQTLDNMGTPDPVLARGDQDEHSRLALCHQLWSHHVAIMVALMSANGGQDKRPVHSTSG